MALIRTVAIDAIARLASFSAVVDARSPAEYALDHLPGAVNWPSLDDRQREVVGTEYKHMSSFAARKRGAAMVARNIASHIEAHLLDADKDWTPLVYCWRGGKRSGALAAVLDQIGFRVHVLEGGYREFRRAVVAELESSPLDHHFRVVCGPTGSGKSRLLQALAAAGAQVLDLEALAEHRGSVLGLVPGHVQPSQKRFDTRVWQSLRGFNRSRPVFVESESKKIGDLRVPEALIQRMRASACIWLELKVERRVAFLLREYDFFVRDPDAFCGRLDGLRHLRSNEVVDAWQSAARQGSSGDVVQALLETHYDPIYRRSMLRNFAGIERPLFSLEWDGSEAGLAAAAASAKQRAGGEPQAA